MADFIIKKGLDIKLDGAPAPEIETLAEPTRFSVYPSDFEGIKIRLKIKQGDVIKQGDILFENKKDERMKFRSPCAGSIQEIILGDRRAPQQIIIEKAAQEEIIHFDKVDPAQTDRSTLVNHLLNAGLWPLIKQRPFSKIADPDTEPKAIFVNGMGTAPFQVDQAVALEGKEHAFQTGLQALQQLTSGAVHVCTAKGSSIHAPENQHTFSGPHPAGNSSIHINSIAPIEPHDTVYTLRAQDVARMGAFLEAGILPTEQVFALAGAEVKPAFRKHYRTRIGASLEELFSQALSDNPVRILSGNTLSGSIISKTDTLKFYDQEINIIEEDEKRIPFGWTTPGLLQYSAHRTNLSSWLAKAKTWKIGTNLHGGHRAMVVTGWYDRYMPLNIMTDYLIRAVLAHDTDEAIQLGILETDPEDFALCAFIDPAKNDLCAIVKRGLEEIEEEGI